MESRLGARIAVVLAAVALAGAGAAAQPRPPSRRPPVPPPRSRRRARRAAGPRWPRASRPATTASARCARASTQTTQSVAFGGDSSPASEPARGRVEFAKPGRMRFEYETPEPSLVVSDGKTLWIYDPVAKEVQVLAVEGDFLSAAAIQFLLGEGRLQESFEVTARSCAPDRAELELRPRAEASYERIELVADPVSGWIRETTVHDLLGKPDPRDLRGHRGRRRRRRGALPLRTARGRPGPDPREGAAMTHALRPGVTGFPDAEAGLPSAAGCRKVRRGDGTRRPDDGPPSPPSGSRRLTEVIAPRGGTLRAGWRAKGASVLATRSAAAAAPPAAPRGARGRPRRARRGGARGAGRGPRRG